MSGANTAVYTTVYKMSDAALEQRRANASIRQFQGFMKTLQARMRLHLDDVARLQEIANMVKHTLSWHQVKELYWDEWLADLNAELSKQAAATRQSPGESNSERHAREPRPNLVFWAQPRRHSATTDEDDASEQDDGGVGDE
jgi:hypothetical protein